MAVDSSPSMKAAHVEVTCYIVSLAPDPPPHFPRVPGTRRSQRRPGPGFTRHNGADTGARKNGTLWQYPNLFRYTQIPSQCSQGKFIGGPNITRVINHPPIKTRHKTLRVIRTVVSIVAVCQI